MKVGLKTAAAVVAVKALCPQQSQLEHRLPPHRRAQNLKSLHQPVVVQLQEMVPKQVQMPQQQGGVAVAKGRAKMLRGRLRWRVGVGTQRARLRPGKGIRRGASPWARF